jgi:hypothetical protein
MNSENIQKLADEMNVSITDLKCFANGIVNSMKKDKVEKIYVNETKENQIKLMQAYAINEMKKFDKFVTTYLSTPEARACFIQKVLSIL